MWRWMLCLSPCRNNLNIRPWYLWWRAGRVYLCSAPTRDEFSLTRLCECVPHFAYMFVFMVPASAVVSTLFHLCTDVSGWISPNQITAINTSRHTRWSKSMHECLYTDLKALHLIYWRTGLKQSEGVFVYFLYCPTFIKLGLFAWRVWLKIIIIIFIFIIIVFCLLQDEGKEKIFTVKFSGSVVVHTCCRGLWIYQLNWIFGFHIEG